MKYVLGAFLVLGALAGCASKPASEDISCTDRDWQNFGLTMAESGREVRTIDKYKNGCADFTEKDLDAYLDGYSRGLISYCTYENGYERGKNNMTINNICPGEIQERYVKGYSEGQREYEIRMEKYDTLQEDSERKNQDEFRQWNRDQQSQGR